MKWDRHLHILCVLHFAGNSNDPDVTDENSGRLQKMQNLFEIIIKTFSKFYSFYEHLVVIIVIVIVLFKGRVIF
jgi:hypothetical protein